MFSTGMMGSGVVIVPEEDLIFAPIDGEVIVLPSTKHAVGIRSDHGLEVLIHVGLESEKVESEFHAYVKEGQSVCRGDKLLKLDRKKLMEKQYRLDTPVIVTNAKDYVDVIKTKETFVKTGDNIMVVI